jgi:hypothetical protein
MCVCVDLGGSGVGTAWGRCEAFCMVSTEIRVSSAVTMKIRPGHVVTLDRIISRDDEDQARSRCDFGPYLSDTRSEFLSDWQPRSRCDFGPYLSYRLVSW